MWAGLREIARHVEAPKTTQKVGWGALLSLGLRQSPVRAEAMEEGLLRVAPNKLLNPTSKIPEGTGGGKCHHRSPQNFYCFPLKYLLEVHEGTYYKSTNNR